ncbi:general secretion pathway protein F [Limimaricola variabilis]|uniref:General secretion pathway protein F n=1 Tax=Limimaricola variabilis TaxID=1492771 RepID=A0ABR6HN57_9RHOB|nr:general secretion pathway protein F [Limimaricola variabilis]
MPVFAYKGYTSAGQSERGRLEGTSEGAAYETLRAMGLSVVELREAGAGASVPWYRREVGLGAGQIPLEAQAALAEQMAVLFRVRLPILEILRVLGAGTQRRDVRGRLERVTRLVAEGLPFAEAFAQAGPRVAPVFTTLLRMGESSNEMPDLLQDLAKHLRSQQRLRAQIAAALIYPAVLVAVGIGVLVLVSLTFAPALEPLFQSRGLAPPTGLAVFLSLRDLVANWGVWLGLVVVALALRLARVGVVTRLPVIGRLAQDTALLRMTRGLELLLRSGMSLPDALDLLGTLQPGAAHAAAMRAAAERLRSGGRAYEAFAQAPRMPLLFLELFRIGEETNTLGAVLGTLSEALAAQIESRIGRLLRALTPALTLMVGALVGLLVHAVMEAVFSVSDLAF